MQQLLLTLGLIFGSLAAGYAVQVLMMRFGTGTGGSGRTGAGEIAVRRASLRRVATRVQRFVITFVNPLVLVSTFWAFAWGAGTLALFPVLGALSHLVGGLAALGAARWMRLPRRAAGSLFTCGAFTNLLSFGGLAAFMFYGEEGYALAMLFRVFEPAVYYAVGFPVARAFGAERPGEERIRVDLSELARDPLILMPVGAMTAGCLLNWLNIPRPEAVAVATPALVMCSTALMLFSVGLILAVKAAPRYRRESLVVAVIKFGILPAVLTAAGLALGYGRIQDGLPLKVLITVSAMPVAFNSLIPPSLYGLDLDLAGACWLVTTVMLAGVLPLLYLVSLI